jgi:hypothetical protein
MPQKYRVTLEGGRQVIVTTDGGPPSEAEIYSYLDQHPLPDEGGGYIRGALKSAGRTVAGTVEQLLRYLPSGRIPGTLPATDEAVFSRLNQELEAKGRKEKIGGYAETAAELAVPFLKGTKIARALGVLPKLAEGARAEAAGTDAARQVARALTKGTTARTLGAEATGTGAVDMVSPSGVRYAASVAHLAPEGSVPASSAARKAAAGAATAATPTEFEAQRKLIRLAAERAERLQKELVTPLAESVPVEGNPTAKAAAEALQEHWQKHGAPGFRPNPAAQGVRITRLKVSPEGLKQVLSDEEPMSSLRQAYYQDRYVNPVRRNRTQ